MLGVDGMRSSVHEDVIFAFDISIKISRCILTYGCSEVVYTYRDGVYSPRKKTQMNLSTQNVVIVAYSIAVVFFFRLLYSCPRNSTRTLFPWYLRLCAFVRTFHSSQFALCHIRTCRWHF